MKKQFSGYDKVISIKLQNLWREFDNLQMKENETVQEFFSKVSTTINQIRGYGDNVNDQKIVEKILRSLSIKFEHVVATIEEAKYLSKLMSFVDLLKHMKKGWVDFLLNLLNKHFNLK